MRVFDGLLKIGPGRSTRYGDDFNEYDVTKRMYQWLAALRDNVSARFPSVDIFESFATLLEPNCLRKCHDRDVTTYGRNELERVLAVFGVDKEDDGLCI